MEMFTIYYYRLQTICGFYKTKDSGNISQIDADHNYSDMDCDVTTGWFIFDL